MPLSDSFSLRRPQKILSLCDYTGNWSQPYEDDGYEVIRVDLAHGQDVRLLRTDQLGEIHGILAAPPCTVFASSGNRWTRSDDDMREGLSVVDACCRLILTLKPLWWCLENPHGTLSRYLGKPEATFQPNDYGADYTKFTCLWGRFRMPVKTPVPALAGSKMHRLAPGPDRAALRSETPMEFARAFFEVNP